VLRTEGKLFASDTGVDCCDKFVKEDFLVNSDLIKMTAGRLVERCLDDCDFFKGFGIAIMIEPFYMTRKYLILVELSRLLKIVIV